MNTPLLPKRIPNRTVVGEKAAFTRTITEADVALFVGVTWDVNPVHSNDEYVRTTKLKRRIVPGLLTASLLTHLGGLWAFMASEMKLEFLAPVFIGDTITAEAVVEEVEEGQGLVRLDCQCVNAAGEKVLQGQIKGYPGRFEA
jgi:3-hydroxybutyryl-CoA dehydratase